jgi:pyochelin biosynthesis protein PchC
MRASCTERSGTWLRTIKQSRNPRVRLVCFPHAGGTAGFFRSWAQHVPDDVELAAVRYPGREDRIGDPFAESFDDLVASVVRECLRLTDAPLAFFGHSMGASVAYEAALRLRTDHGTSLAGLFVSGRAAPGHEQRENLAESSDQELTEHLIGLGGTDAQALAIPELRELVLPAVRADYRLIERYRPTITEGALDAPVAVYYGSDEPDLGEESLVPWSRVTSATWHMRSFKGGHFYIVDHGLAVLADIIAGLSSR